MQERGFSATSVRDIVRAAGVTQGSFTNHFASKEAFALEILQMQFLRDKEIIEETLQNDSLRPLARLRLFLETKKGQVDKRNAPRGSLVVNFSVGATDNIRRRVASILEEYAQAVAYCLRAALKAGEVHGDIDCDQVASFVVSAMQGAMMVGKVQRTSTPLDAIQQILFSAVLRPK
jgi:TetR/AcrR family transcriptional repressor of nem operon